jgi:hypothetical protein
VISDNYKWIITFPQHSGFVPEEGLWFTFCSILLARHTFGFIYDRAEGRACLPFSLLVFSSLFSQYPQPRRLMVTSHTRSPLGRAPGFTLTPGTTPGIFVIPGDFSFVLLCTPSPGLLMSRLLSEVAATSFSGTLRLGLQRSQSVHWGSRFRCYRNSHDLSYQKSHHSNQLR